ncbi:hypothetical protein HDU86_004041 [Geranomyces michiganensis]|nr:hypothetical protein HDU86_004041 [Geranomyces michiganensis]
MVLRPETPEKVSEATWTLERVAPFLRLLDDERLRVKYDNTQTYDWTRPDVQVYVKSCGRTVSNWEIKSKWAGDAEKAKDKARIILSTLKCLRIDEEMFDTGDPPPVRLAVHAPGEEVCVYEVMGYKGMAIAVEVAHFAYLAELRSGTTTALVEAFAMFVAIMVRKEKPTANPGDHFLTSIVQRRIETLHRRMLADKAKGQRD